MFGDRINRNSWRRIGNTVRGWEAMSRRPQKLQPRKTYQDVGGDNDVYIGQMESDVDLSVANDIKSGTLEVYAFNDAGTQLLDTGETIEDVINPWPAKIAAGLWVNVARETASGRLIITTKPTGIIHGLATADFDDGDASFTIDSLTRHSGIVGFGSSETVYNDLDFVGLNNDVVYAEWFETDQQWHVIRVKNKVFSPLSDWQVDGANNEIEEKTRKLAVPAQAESGWTVVHTGDDC